MSDTRSFTPVSAVLPQSLWPADLFALDDSSSFLDNLACLAFDTTAEENSLKIFVKAKVMAETRLRLPFLQGISFVLSEGDGPDAGLINVDILAKTYPDAPPLIEIFMSTTVLSLSIDPQLFRPVEVKEEEGKLIVIPKEGALNIPLPFALKLKYENGEWSLDFQVPAEEEASLNIPTCMIGNTGIIFKVSGSSLNLSGSADGARPQGTEAGWKGLYLKQVELYIPELFAGHIEAKGLGIGTGGFTGSISWIGNPVLKPDKSGFEKGVGSGSLFGIPFALKEVNIEFRQNSFVRSQVKGILIFPFFDQPTVVDVNLATDGDFAIALSSDQSALPSDLVPEKNGELFVFTKEGLFDLTIKGLAFERSADKFLLSINGSIKPKLRGLEWPEFEVRSLFIDSKGRIKIDGGWIDLPKQKSFDLYGFSVNITKLGFGNEENGTKWIALSGGIKLVDGLPLEGGVEGLKIKWKPPTDIKMELGGVSVAFEIKDVLKFDGSVVFMDEPPRRGFKGGVKMVLYPLDGCSLDVQLMV